jgi:glycosyltransferase involved in cell wall biosynthesis
MLHLTVWMNIPSFHQGSLFRALSACEGVELQVVFAKDLTADRIDLGWHTDLAGFSYRFLNQRNRITDAIRLARSQRERVHVVNGLWSEQAFAAALVTLAISASKYAIYSEAPDPGQRRSVAKRFLQRTFGKIMAPRAAGVLAVSRLAAEFYRSLNVSSRGIYPFGYFRSSPPPRKDPRKASDKRRIEIVFAGQLVYRKGVDLLLEAIQPLFEQYPNLFLIVVGGGELCDSIMKQAEALGIVDRVAFEGVIASSVMPERLAAADLLVLPSRFDGWGMVVNEALSVGTPVIVSDRCGSADLVQNGVNGFVFRSEDVSDLRRCLSEFLEKETGWRSFRTNAAATGERISAEAAAAYLIDCLKHMTGALQERPRPPWIQSSKISAHSFPT